ncbi:MAG TPA: M1 family aminopeptidase, partial [Burkholderiales bacterium]|nr:M1 family aminopeptidase [Burkholderiales bacterium]
MRRCAVRFLVAALASCTMAASAAPRAHLGLEVHLDPETRKLHAIAELSATRESTFLLHPSLTIVSASANGQAVNARIVEGNEQLRRWHIAAPREAQWRIEYGGTLPALDRTIDHRGVLRARGPMAAAEGSFLPAGSGWYPEPAARFSYRVRLSLPAGQRGLVPGRLAAESTSGVSDRYEANFEFDAPAEGIDLMAGPYTVREKLVPREGRPPLRLRTYFYGDMEALAEGYLQDSERYIALYTREIGDYPFDAFAVVASPLPTGFGMPTLTYIGREVLKLPFIRGTSLGHEVLHNWWGNGVYVDYAKGNWSEGLTTFMADYFYKERESAAAAREMRLAWLRDFAAVPPGAHRPLATFRSRTHGAEAVLGYGKAAMVFLMLRDEIGEAAFRDGVRRFWKTHRFRTASWDDLRHAFEKASGRGLGRFFEQWIERSGGPSYRS